MTTTSTERRAGVRQRAVVSAGFAGLAYLAFVAVSGYAVAFLAGRGVPRTVDSGGPYAGTATAVPIDLLLLAGFAMQHSVMARPAFKRRWTRFVPQHLERASYILAASAVLALTFWQWRPVPAVAWDLHGAAARAVLWTLFVLGWVLVVAMTFAIDHLDMLGLRQVGRHLRGHRQTEPVFKLPLPYRLVRHPMMTGFVIAFLATPLMTAGHLLFALVSCGYIIVAVRLEERDLAETLPEYRHYATGTPRFVPRLSRQPTVTASLISMTPVNSPRERRQGRSNQMTASVGIAFTPFEDRVEVIERAAILAEQRGLDSVGVAEAMTLAAPIVLARLAERTEQIRLVTGVLSVWGRTAATLALTAAELQRASDGRFVLGLGGSTAPITEGFHGQSWEAPLQKLRDSVVAVRALLRGDRLPQVPDGARPLRLGCPPTAPVPIALAAITAPSIRLAGAVADQWLPFLLPPVALDAGRELMADAAADAGRADAATVTASVPLAVAPDHDGAARIAARWLITYATRMGPVYPRMLRQHGYGRELDALLDANPRPNHARLPAAAERLARDVLLYGTYDEAPQLRRAWLSHTDALALVAPFGVPPEQITDTIEAISGPMTDRSVTTGASDALAVRR